MNSRDVPTPFDREEASARNASDVELAREVLAGSEAAWHQFIERYSGLLITVIRRHLPNDREDQARTLFADVLESLYRGKLAKYSGRSALSTWLTIVAHSAIADHLRRKLGGRGLRRIVKQMDPFDRRLFRLYFVEGLSFGTVMRMVSTPDRPMTADALLESLERLDRLFHGQVARRLEYDLHPQAAFGVSGRLLEYFDHVRAECDSRSRRLDPEYEMLEREARRTVDAVLGEIERLPSEDRRLLTLRFEQGWTAHRIAREMGMDGQRAVYTAIERVVRGLRRFLARAPERARAGDPPGARVAITSARKPAGVLVDRGEVA